MPVYSGLDNAQIVAAAQALRDGELVAFPTETVYGLGARADDDRAVARIFAAKGRPSEHPLIVHVADLAAARHFAARLDDSALRLAAAFWPGPVTLIAQRAAGLAGTAAGGQDSIGLRCPAHPVAKALLRECALQGVAGVAAPSANRFGRISPTTVAHVLDEFGPGLRVLDGGACAVGIESAIVDCRGGRASVLRPGVISRAELEQALGAALTDPDDSVPRAPGTLAAHYAPRAALRLVDAPALRALLAAECLQALPGQGLAVYSRTRLRLPALALGAAMPAEPLTAARDLFADLRALDRPDIQRIWVECPPAAPQWAGVQDRLRRAAAASFTDA